MKKIAILGLLLLASCQSTPPATTAHANDNNTPGSTTIQSAENTFAGDDPENGGPQPDEADNGVVSGDMTYNGTLVLPPQSKATVSLSMDGIVRSTSLLPGSYVKKGTVLAVIENPDFIELQQTFLDASAQLEFLESEYRRQSVLSQEEVASRKRLEQSKAEYLSMKSRKDAAQARLSMIGIESAELVAGGIKSLYEVKAPISGYLSDIRMNIGKHVPAGEPLCEILDNHRMLLKITAYERDLQRMNTGDRIEFRVNGLEAETFSGRITTVGHSVDGTNRSIEIYASIDRTHPMFRPGMYVNARVLGK